MQRHGESENNIKKIFTCRKLNPGLSVKGIKQIYDKINYYQNKNISKIYSSPSKRAIETSEILSKSLMLNYQIIDCLAEINVGDLEGKSELEPENIELFFKIVNNWRNNVDDYFPDGEDLTELNKSSLEIIAKNKAIV